MPDEDIEAMRKGIRDLSFGCVIVAIVIATMAVLMTWLLTRGPA